jgi:hypothetical protein
MSNTNTGGQAFPFPAYTYPNGEINHGEGGMTMRDYFAGEALSSINLGIGVTDEFYSKAAKHCYALADAMLKAREA